MLNVSSGLCSDSDVKGGKSYASVLTGCHKHICQIPNSLQIGNKEIPNYVNNYVYVALKLWK